ncbi:hypothetical protein CPER28S_00605 [Cellulomonas persica]
MRTQTTDTWTTAPSGTGVMCLRAACLSMPSL